MTPDEIARLPYRDCVGIMIVDRSDRIFAGERIDTPDAWQMPQGGIDPGETPREAALRELAEETGLGPDKVRIEAETADWIHYDLPPELVPNVWKGRFRGQRQRWFRMRFTGAESDIDISGPPPEFSQWQWVAPDTLLTRIVPFKRDVYRKVLAALRVN